MHSIKKAILYGFLVWLIPFVVSVLIFSIHDTNRPLFESVMPVALAGSVVIFALLYFKKIQSVSVNQGLKLGLIWLAISLLIDWPLFSSGRMAMGLGEYISDIGVTYLMIPIITIGFGGALCGRTPK